MPAIPKENITGLLSAFFQHGYPFIQKRCQHYNSDVFQVALPGKRIIFMTGAEAAKVFYDNSKFKRKGAIPERIKKSLIGKKAIHTYDGEKHFRRKNMMMSLMTEENISYFTDLVAKYWEESLQKWEKKKRVNLFEESQKIMCQAACEWAGIRLEQHEVRERANDLIALVDAFGAIGPRHWRGRAARKRTEDWIIGKIVKAREETLEPQKDNPIEVVAHFRDIDGKPLEKREAAVELINLVRPTVAISYYIAFCAHALYTYPEYKQKVAENNDNFQEMFAQEVRRYYPFAPVMGALVKENFEWRGYKFPKGALVILDLYGTNHDSRYWERPRDFYPEQFRNWSKSPFDFIPHGGGDHFNGHRCPGEWITIEAMKVSLKFLTRYMTYDVPLQDFTYDIKRMPTYPKSGMLLSKVKATGEKFKKKREEILADRISHI